MSVFSDFLQEYGVSLLYALVTAVFGFLGAQAKKLWQRWFCERTKERAAHTVVKAIEQIYTDLHGEEKLKKALCDLEAVLAEKGVTASALELRLLLESALAEYNKAFEKSKNPPPPDSEPERLAA